MAASVLEWLSFVGINKPILQIVWVTNRAKNEESDCEIELNGLIDRAVDDR